MFRKILLKMSKFFQLGIKKSDLFLFLIYVSRKEIRNVSFEKKSFKKKLGGFYMCSLQQVYSTTVVGTYIANTNMFS